VSSGIGYHWVQESIYRLGDNQMTSVTGIGFRGQEKQIRDHIRKKWNVDIFNVDFVASVLYIRW